MGNHTINAVPVIDGNVDVTENCKYEKTPLAGEVINIFMLQLIKKLNELTEGVIITKDDIMLEKKLYEVTDDLHKSFVQHGYQNPVKILNEEFSNVNSYMHYLPSELIKNVQTYLKHNPSVINYIYKINKILLITFLEFHKNSYFRTWLLSLWKREDT